MLYNKIPPNIILLSAVKTLSSAKIPETRTRSIYKTIFIGVCIIYIYSFIISIFLPPPSLVKTMSTFDF